MKHDRVPSLGFWEEGGLQKESTPCEVGVVQLGVKMEIWKMLEVLLVYINRPGVRGWRWISLRDTEDGVGSSQLYCVCLCAVNDLPRPHALSLPLVVRCLHFSVVSF